MVHREVDQGKIKKGKKITGEVMAQRKKKKTLKTGQETGKGPKRGKGRNRKKKKTQKEKTVRD